MPGQESSSVPGAEGESGGPSQPQWEYQEGGGGTPSDDGSEEGGGGTPSDDSWEEGGSSDPDGWETSNQVPGAEPSDAPPMPSERGGSGSEGDSDVPGGSGADGELEEALEVFDGEILAEREVIRSRANETTAGGVIPDLPEPTDVEEGDAQSGTASMPRNRNPAPPVAGGSGRIPDDIPDARDDDIIARQLREAAMSETDLELKEKLWDEYRRYKGA